MSLTPSVGDAARKLGGDGHDEAVADAAPAGGVTDDVTIRLAARDSRIARQLLSQ